jgi:hypothetical protein
MSNTKTVLLVAGRQSAAALAWTSRASGLGHRSHFDDCFQTRYRLIARREIESERFSDGRPSFVIADSSIGDMVQNLFGDDVIGLETTEHLKKRAASLAKDVQFLDMSPKHLRHFNYCVIYQAAIDCTLNNALESDHFSEQDQRDALSLKPIFALTLSPVRTGYVNRGQNDCDSADSLRPSGGARMTLNPSQYRFRKLETVEHSV